MDQKDLYYLGFNSYSKELDKDKEIIKLRRVIRQANIENDSLETVRINCDIDENWVKNIEEGLIYVDKAIREERQFIRVEGEVVPIERAKHISKTTVEHLAKHSNLITHLPKNEGDDLVPDKIYVVEKESDYAVYENRFLYMMLIYLRDFMALRINKIRDRMTTYQGKLAMNKKISMANRQMLFKIDLSDEIKDDPILIEKYKSIQMIDRVELQYHFVLSLLSTDLMQQVSKAPMIKPPIIKTNTLKMNTNFKTALALYDYIASYNEPGYKFTTEDIQLAPLSDDVANDYTASIVLQAFLTYKNTNGLTKLLKKSMEDNEKIIREQEKHQRSEQLKRLHRYINENNTTLEEYLILLETHNRQLEKDCLVVESLTKRVAELEKNVQELEKDNSNLNEQIEKLVEDINQKKLEIDNITQKAANDLLVMEQLHRVIIRDLNKKHELEIINLNELHAREIENLNHAHQEELNRIARMHAEEIDNINKNHTFEIEELNKDHVVEISNLNQQHSMEKEEAISQATKNLVDEKEKILGSHRKELTKSNDKIDSLNNDIKEKDGRIDTLSDDKKRLINDYEDKIFNLIKAHREQIEVLNKEIDKHLREIKSLNREHEREILTCEKRIEHLIKERNFVEAQLHIIRVEQGKITDEYDYTSKERFEELETQYRAFKQLFKKEWGKVKQDIRKKVFTEEQSPEEDLKEVSKKKGSSNSENKVKKEKLLKRKDNSDKEEKVETEIKKEVEEKELDKLD